MSEFRFAEPGWAYAFYALAVGVAALFWSDRRGGGALHRFVSLGMQTRLVEAPSPWRRRSRLGLLSLSAMFLILALMRPQWGMRFVTSETFGAEIMICLDVSRSMLAEDVAPSRLERAKAELADLITYLDGNQVGLIAFAGRATVVSPLTPDFSFLRLVLDRTGVHSVSRGGTQLEEPIRKALAGFGPSGEATRAILLITDGEDHDSFPLDAARAAAELGVRIIAIGFGDEEGSEIFVRDRRTGARHRILDADGRPVRSRLDGNLLREIALETGGAYVPAGTGLLDLESIYDQHIARLTRAKLSDRGRSVREEVYQWAVLAALISLVSSVVVTGGRIRLPSGFPGAGLLLLAMLWPLASLPGAAVAASNDDTVAVAAPGDAVAGSQSDVDLDDDPESEPGEPTDTAVDPREVYNRGVSAVGEGDLEAGESGFRNARRDAAGDGALRFHAAYNLGWTLAERAETRQESEPEAALRFLYEAADWFREAIRLRSDDDRSRHNLEVVLNRALMLSDALAKRGEGDVGALLDAVVAGQRAAVGGSAILLERVTRNPGPHVDEALRPEFRAAAAAQRSLLFDADELSRRASLEGEALSAMAEEERTPEDAMRGAQLESLLHYLHLARERMGQARQQLRRREAGRAVRRSSAALDELKRAQDQLRDPVGVLDRVIEGATEIASQIGALSAAEGQLLVQPDRGLPAWLTRGLLIESQQSLVERTGELHARLQAGSARPPPADPSRTRELQVVASAEPLVQAGHDALGAAAGALETDLSAALTSQVRGIAALREARERFLDLRGLLETIHRDESQVAAILGSEDAEVREAIEEMLPTLLDAQRKNLERVMRLGVLLDDDARAIEGAAANPEADAEALESQRRRLEAANVLLDLVGAEMQDAFESLGGARASADLDEAAVQTAHTVQLLESLRRLFFSTAERVRELAERQVELNDETRDAAAAVSDAEISARTGPLVPRQISLSERSEKLALALEEQSRRASEGEDPAAAKETSDRLRLAADHLLLAQESMTLAAKSLAGVPPVFDTAQPEQQVVLVELSKALEQLAPPEQHTNQNQADSGQDDAGRPGDESEAEGGEDQPQNEDPAQLLQGVRDREAQRREQQEARGQSGYETVEKDW